VIESGESYLWYKLMDPMKAKTIIILLLAVLLIIFALQNTELIHVKCLFWGINVPLALLIFVCFAVGVIIGIILPRAGTKKKKVEKTTSK